MTDETLRELGKQLPHDRPTTERSDGVRASLLAAATAPQVQKTRRWLFVGGGFAAGALAAAAVAILVVRPHREATAVAPEAHVAYAQIESSTAAALEHTLIPTAAGTDELVRVHAGTVRLAVPATRAGDRVRVTTGDAELEGTGAYEVVVIADVLSSVSVTEGTATLKLAGQQRAVFLAAGQSWRAKVETADLTPAAVPSPAVPVPAPTPVVAPPAIVAAAAPRPTASPARVAAPKVTDQGSPIEDEVAPPRPAVTAPAQQLQAGSAAPAVATPSPGSLVEKHFQAGQELLRANKLAEAITELGAAADAGDGALAADARYYQAVALVKAKRGAEAERALVQFLDRAPASIRRGRAAMMLGRLLADRGDGATAKTWFELAAKDADPAVAAAANAALR